MNIDLNRLKNGLHGGQAKIFIVKYQYPIIFIFPEHLLFLANTYKALGSLIILDEIIRAVAKHFNLVKS